MVSPVGVATAARDPALTECRAVRGRGRRPEWTARMCVIAAWMVAAPAVQAQEPSPLARVDALALDTARVGRVTAHFAPGDGQRAAQLAELAEEAAAFFERELGLSFQFRLAVLSPGHWFSEFEGGPYTIPWYSPAEALIIVPSSDEGLPAGSSFPRAVDFIPLHEYGHLAAKRYFHSGSARAEIPLLWFEELLATYFAYSFVASWDPPWAETMRGEWAANVAGFSPRERSLDWRCMGSLPPAELGRTYGWYQNLLNVRAAEIHDGHGVAFLPALKEGLSWADLEHWETGSLLPHLDAVSPGFEAWADRLESGTDRPGSLPQGASPRRQPANDGAQPLELAETNDNRVPEGTEVRVSVRHAVTEPVRIGTPPPLQRAAFVPPAPGAPLIVHGLRAGTVADDTLHVAPGTAREVRFRADAPGTYLYWGALSETPFDARTGRDAQLAGAIVVDPAGVLPDPHERVFVMTVMDIWADSTGPPPYEDIFEMAINGLSWPHTERLHYAVGDTVRWHGMELESV
jgi:hypothetical protein